MKNFYIKIKDKTIKTIDGLPSCIGEIRIDNFIEEFVMPLDYWSQKDYQEQWKDGINRIQKFKKSCLVASIQDLKKRPFLNLWLLYKSDDKIFIQNQIMFGKKLSTKLKKIPFNINTYQKFIKSRTKKSVSGMAISEWVINDNFAQLK